MRRSMPFWFRRQPLKCRLRCFAQLREGGRMIVPIGPSSSQELAAYSQSTGGEPEVNILEGCRFVPLVEGVVWRAPRC
jgi:protein-L-isoaspartate O-methyltransferase